MIGTIAFGILSALLVGSSFLVVRSKSMVRAVLWLGVMLGCTALGFVRLGAPFLAGIQLLLYVGGVMTLMIFGVLLTRRADGIDTLEDRPPWRAAIASVGLFAVFARAILLTDLPTEPVASPDTKALGEALLGEHLFAFEVLSALLLATMVAAIVLARRRDPSRGPEAEEAP